MENGEQPRDIAEIRAWLNMAFDEVELDAFCHDHFPEVYDKFGRGMRKDEKITLLLDHVRLRGEFDSLLTVVRSPREVKPPPKPIAPVSPKPLWSRVRAALGDPMWQGISAIVGILACIVIVLTILPIRDILLGSDTATLIPTTTVTVPLAPTSTLAPTPTPMTTLQTTTPGPTWTPTCPAVRGPFTVAWNSVRGAIGCAVSQAITGLIAEENFEGGKMFWREPIDYAQILVLFNDGTWQIIEHAPYVEGSPEFSCSDENTPSRCPPTPKRGFGMVWCDTPWLRRRLGNAVDCERDYQGTMQQFERGFMIQTDSGATYAFYDDGRWQRR